MDGVFKIIKIQEGTPEVRRCTLAFFISCNVTNNGQYSAVKM